jgi:hypothetical protein
MLNKILVFGGLALSAILIVENIVWRSPAYLFIDTSSTAWMLSVVSTCIGAVIWFGIKSMMITDDNSDEDSYDF